MIAFWLSLPMQFRVLLIGVFGILGGALANHIIYAFAYYNQRNISPWGAPPENAPPRHWTDKVPVLGWFGLRREGSLHGNGFWVRPLLIELGTAIGLMMLFRFETVTGGLLPPSLSFPRALAAFEPTATSVFFAHAVLCVLMIAATFIDFDEKIIPDVITIPGTLIALVMASCTTMMYMPTMLPVAGIPQGYLPTTFDSPWFTVPNQWLVTSSGLWVGLAIWSSWCFALLDRRWSRIVWHRRGLTQAVRHFFNGIFHYGFWKVIAAIWLLGGIGIFYVNSLAGMHWHGLFTALVGLAVGGGIIWSIRILAALALNKEAMGFGDVTLMAMIGAFLGWQAAAMTFFLSPFAAIAIVLVRFILTRDHYTPFGPYLCAGAMITILYWDRFYNGYLAFNLLTIGQMLLAICAVMLVLMGVMLFIWRLIKTALFRE